MTDPTRPLGRDRFRAGCFARDRHACVVPGCRERAVDARHLIDRELWGKSDPHPGGYCLANGASLCGPHHRHAEADFFPPQALRRWLDLPIVLPRQLDTSCIWDKWGRQVPTVGLTPKPDTVSIHDTNRIDILIGKPLAVRAVPLRAEVLAVAELRDFDRHGQLVPGWAGEAETAGPFDAAWSLRRWLGERLDAAITDGHAAIVVRNLYPFHVGRVGDHVARFVI